MRDIWLVGAGPMGAAHAAAMADLGLVATVVSQGAERAEALAGPLGWSSRAGGIDAALADGPAPEVAVVAVPVQSLAATATALVEAGTRRILLEKPGGVSLAELRSLRDAATERGTSVTVAYNRRFMASTAEARRRIAAASRVLSFSFEFTEVGARIPATTPASVTGTWALANSSHVIDLAFHLCGVPDALTCSTSGQGELDWHPAASVFQGFGATTSAVPFTYFSDWRGPGRWWLEVVLPDERLVMRPLERLQRVPNGRFDPEPVPLEEDLDQRFKPGIHAQMAAFLAGGDPRLCDLGDHVNAIERHYFRMWGYGT
jgi:predicted dehydrogenase